MHWGKGTMYDAIVSPGVLNGTVRVPSSKSAGHRAMLCAALANGTSLLTHLDFSKDMDVTLGAIQVLGCTVSAEQQQDGTSLHIAAGAPPSRAEIDCGESGSTLRFLIPICAALGIETIFTGHGRLPERPIGIYLDLLPHHGITCKTEGGLPLQISGKLTPGTFSLPGDVSSQFITGLLLALPLLQQDSTIELTTPLESAAYVTMTLETMRDFGLTVTATENGWHVPGNQQYHARSYEIEGDWSQAAFFLAAAALGSSVSIVGLRKESTQGDKACADLFAQFGAQITWDGNLLHAEPNTLHGIEIDASQIPDLVPALSVAAALADGESRIYNAARLRIKESDRLAAMANALNGLGAQVTETPDSLLFQGVKTLKGGTDVQGCNDHRVVMALAIAALRAQKPVCIHDAQSITKSYTHFFEDYKTLGGTADVCLGNKT